MGRYVININERTRAGRLLLQYLRGINVVQSEYMTGMEEAMDDVKNGRVETIDDIDAFFRKMGCNV